MIKKYFYTILISTLLFSVTTFSQENKSEIGTSKAQETSIEGLTIYPNPVSNGKIYITSKLGLEKKLSIYDVLGKKVFEAIVSNSKEVNISALNTGVYIVKVKEGEASATRKLIIN